MDRVHKLHIVLQFLHEEGYTRAFEALENDRYVLDFIIIVSRCYTLKSVISEVK